jgi:hypothetical protein
MPPLALPAAGYWLAMAALTYFFAHLGPHPLDAAEARAEPHEELRAPPPPPQEPAVAAPTPAVEPAPAAELQAEVPELQDEPPPPTADAKPTADAHDDDRSQPAATTPERPRLAQLSEPSEPARTAEPPRSFSFPEFTDSSRPVRREHAADGPRLDSLFERAEDRPAPGDAEKPSAPPETAPVDGPITSCEAAIARNTEQITIGAARGGPDISREAYASILQNGRYLTSCKIPDRTVFEICAAVRNGRAIGITVSSSPSTPALNACVRGAVARLKFPSNERLDVTHTRFDAAPH